jgi:DNA-binding NarL/FixJ family response regulator
MAGRSSGLPRRVLMLTPFDLAEALVISQATVKTHVRHVLQNLGLRDRVQAVASAYEAGLP